MSKAMQLIGIILLGIFTLVIIYLISDVRSTNELDYYLLQEVTEAAMYDSVDYSYYRETGLLKVDRDMFLENFNRRFAESVEANRDYSIKIIDFNETPPKVSIEVTAPTIASVKGEVALITNRVSGIIETIYDDYVYSRGQYGEVEIDDEAPKIEITGPNSSGKYTIKMTDNYVLSKYAIVQLGSNGIQQFTNSDYAKITNWVSIEGFRNTWEIQQGIQTGTNGFWVVAVDLGGTWTAKPISDLNPWISQWAYNPDNEGTISATFKDDRGLKSYTIASVSCSGTVWVGNNGKATCDGSWKTNSQSTVTIDQTTTDDSGNIKATKTITVNSADYYELSVTDSSGQVSNKVYIQGKRKHEITIDYNVNNGKLTGTITDTYGDLVGYQITNSEATPSNWKTGTYGNTITIPEQNIDTAKTWYIHAKDSTGKTATVHVNTIVLTTIYEDSNGMTFSSGQQVNTYIDCNKYQSIIVYLKLNSFNGISSACGGSVCNQAIKLELLVGNDNLFLASKNLIYWNWDTSGTGTGVKNNLNNGLALYDAGKQDARYGEVVGIQFDLAGLPVCATGEMFHLRFNTDGGGGLDYSVTITKIVGIN